MLVPIYGFLEGDSMGLLLLAHDDMTIADVVVMLRDSARVRVNWPDNAEARFRDKRLDPSLTVAEAGIAALDRIDVRRTA